MLLRKVRFTLIEMLIVISIIAILASMMLPSLQRSIEMGRIISCQSNLRNFGIQQGLYADNNNGYIIPHDNWNNILGRYTGPKMYECASALGFDSGQLWMNYNYNGILFNQSMRLDYSHNRWTGFIAGSYQIPTPKVSVIKKPSKKHWLADGKLYYYGANDDPGNLQLRLSVRHGGNANFVYIDNHVEQMNIIADYAKVIEQAYVQEINRDGSAR